MVTYGAIPFANIPWYRSQIIQPRLKDSADDWPSPLSGWPQVLHVGALEGLVELVPATKEHMLELVEEKEQQHYMEIGDWDRYLAKRAASEQIQPLKLVQDAFDEFFAGLVGEDRIAELRQMHDAADE